MKPPELLSISGIEGGDERADSFPRRDVVTTCDTDNHFVFHHQRGVSDPVAPSQCARRVLRVGHGDVPKQLSRVRINREEMRIYGTKEECSAEDCQTAIRDMPPATRAVLNGV